MLAGRLVDAVLGAELVDPCVETRVQCDCRHNAQGLNKEDAPSHFSSGQFRWKTQWTAHGFSA